MSICSDVNCINNSSAIYEQHTSSAAAMVCNFNTFLANRIRQKPQMHIKLYSIHSHWIKRNYYNNPFNSPLSRTIRASRYQKKLVPCGTDGRLLLSGFQALVTRTLTWIGSYGLPSCITRKALSTYHISMKSEKLFLWTDYLQGPVQVQGHVTQKLG